ncbi:hypothetical protein BBJ28_00011701 [Nothophytophthora sp. Chile5]|nr:hypothetical protein BBJ28_00011701 [Nothophytophthora sp. Chile5]
MSSAEKAADRVCADSPGGRPEASPQASRNAAIVTPAPSDPRTVTAATIQSHDDGVATSLSAVKPILPALNDLPVTPTNETRWASEVAADPQEFQHAVQQVGRLLQALPLLEMSSEFSEAIARMVDDGEAPPIRFAQELERTFASMNGEDSPTVQPDGIPVEQLVELQAAVWACIVATLTTEPSVELLAVWSVIQAAASKAAVKTAAKPNATPTSVPTPIPATADSVSLTANEVFGSSLIKTMADKSTPIPKQPLVPCRKQVNAALARMCKTVVPSRWNSLGMRTAIVSDFFQTGSLFFTALYVPVLATWAEKDNSSFEFMMLRLLRGFYEIMSLDVSPLVARAVPHGKVTATVAVILLLVLLSCLYASYVWSIVAGGPLYRRMIRTLKTNEGSKWETFPLSERRYIKYLGWVIVACVTLYQPLLRLCYDVIMAQYHWVGNIDEATDAGELITAQFGNSSTHTWIVNASYIVGLSFMVPLPLFLLSGSRLNLPGWGDNPTTAYDMDGDKVEFDEFAYARQVAHDPVQRRCPYRSIYSGLKPKQYGYKIAEMAFKILRILLVVTYQFINAGVPCAVYMVYSAVYPLGMQPFSDPHNNFLNVSGRVAALATCAGGARSLYISDSRSSVVAIAAVVIILNVLHLVVIGIMLLAACPWTRAPLKNEMGWLNFSDTSNGREDALVGVVTHWQLEKEVKHRMWQAWWRATLLSLSQKPEKANKTKSADGSTMAHRLVELEHRAMAKGMLSIYSPWLGSKDSVATQLRHAICKALEGVDAIWNAKSTGQADSTSTFGRLVVSGSPFRCAVTYDDAGDMKDVDCGSKANLVKFLCGNFSPCVVLKRELRQKVRALSRRDTKIRFPFSRTETVYIKNGVVQEAKSEGAESVDFKCNYTWGVLRLTTSGNDSGEAMAQGFNVTMIYTDGEGEAKDSQANKVHRFTDRQAVMGSDHIGLTPQMEESDQLRKILAQTQTEWTAGLAELCLEAQGYRRTQLGARQAQTNPVLSDAFWFDVYNDARLPRDALERHLTNREVNPRLQALPTSHTDGLDALYQRMAFVQSHPARMFWYVFWDDVFTCNREIERFRDLARDLDPREIGSICYHVMPREQLEAWLLDRRLLSKWRLFRPRLLDMLYSEMNKHMAKGAENDNGRPQGSADP